jgi:H/ACA ribonucleoprotein complex subunit 4
MDIKKIKQKKSIKELLEFGIVNIDKSSGPTSFNISDFVRKNLGLRKTSHFGTLDPKVTGVLPIALNRACKLTGYFLGEDKEYVGIMRMHEKIDLKDIKKIIKEKFMGKIVQMPPVKSRVKRQEREREIKKFELLEEDGKDILFHVECEGGTYIRKLISDLGDDMKIGAHMLELRRIRAGPFTENDKNYPSVNLYDFEKAVEEYKKGDEDLLKKIIIPGEIISEKYPVVEIKKNNLKQIFTGKPIHKEDLKKDICIEKDSTICVFCEKRFIGMYKIINDKNIFAKSEFVMQEIK